MVRPTVPKITNFPKIYSPPSARSLALTSPSSLGSNSIVSDFSDSISENPGLWSKDGQPLKQGSNQTVSSDTSVASVGVAFEQSKFDLNGDEACSDFYDEIRSRSGTRKAVRSMSLDSACPGHFIAPRQLAELFGVFSSAEGEENPMPTEDRPVVHPAAVYQPVKVTKEAIADGTDSDAATEVTSNTFSPSSVLYNPKVESLQRECDALKQIINSDSAKLLTLQGERKGLQENLDRCTREKRELEKHVRSLQLEREASLQRQKNQDETIRRLRAELTNVPKDKTYFGASLHDIEELRLANELLASQVVQAERELQRANSDNSDKENVPPPLVTPEQRRTKNDWGVSSPSNVQESARLEVLADISPQTLALQLKSLESRLKAVEDDNISRISKEAREHVDKATQCEDADEEETMVLGWSITLDGIDIEGIEVGLDGKLSIAKVEVDDKGQASQDTKPSPEAKPSKCSEEYFCDCFPVYRDVEENADE